MKTGVIQKKEYKVDFETGSGSLYIPVLGDLFPNLWGQKMNPVDKWILTIDNMIYTVDKDFYDSVSEGDKVEIYYDNGLPEVKPCGN
ncbi:hypothetical protein GGR21_000266 [Dysgonomonas hofstadii]|uniref:Uncharacterized protein n=1 Tax=Dysgonomonas hofstadii TaxID=637886 RepID=A0A840CGN4_9BACT|nr:hypothetical protein [Dysgonomonas hofstadii]MBB4034381.1 hypothetical protein [Dysgonomonas hofstadii]